MINVVEKSTNQHDENTADVINLTPQQEIVMKEVVNFPPVLLVKKNNGEYRCCFDGWYLNEVTKRDSYPLPLVNDILKMLANTKYSLINVALIGKYL